MSKTKLNIMIIIFILTAMSLFTACSSGEDEAKKASNSNDSKAAEKAEEEKVKEEVEPTLAEQGFTIDSYTIDEHEAMILFDLQGPEGEYFGMMNSDFKWVIKPTTEIVDYEYTASESEHEVYFGEGLLRAAVKEDREIRANHGRENEALKWGYLDTKGEWAIKPNYRHVSGFTSGVAIVNTIEEDRDDLSNTRQIVIDQTGKELFELIPTYNFEEELEEDYIYENFSNGYLKTDKGFYDTSGKFHLVDFIVEDEDSDEWGRYKIIGDRIVDLDGMSVAVYDFSGKVVKRIPLNKEFIEEPYNLFTTEGLAKEKKFIVVGNDPEGDSSSKLMDLDGKKYGENIEPPSDEDTRGTAEPYLLQYDEEQSHVYNFNGEKLGTIPSSAGGLFNDRYWIEGNEYDKLVTLDGQVIIDEDKKIKVGEGSLDSRIIKANRRINAEDPEMTDILLNTETFESITFDEILTR